MKQAVIGTFILVSLVMASGSHLRLVDEKYAESVDWQSFLALGGHCHCQFHPQMTFLAPSRDATRALTGQCAFLRSNCTFSSLLRAPRADDRERKEKALGGQLPHLPHSYVRFWMVK